MKRRVVVISVILVLAAAGAEPVGADMRGEVVCGVPANEAVLITRQLDNGSWRIWTPVPGSVIDVYRTEEAALARWDATFVCEVTIRVNFREYTARFYRLRLEMMSGAIAGESEDPRILIVGVPSGTVEAFRDCRSDMCPEMVTIPAGRFRMGCVSGKGCSNAEKPVHEVTIAAFALSKYEVTFVEYDRFTDATGRQRVDDEGWGRGRRPVIRVFWGDAVAYTEWLSEKTGERYRLPSEAEWEYAARAGSETKYHFGDEESQLCRYGNHADTSTDYRWRNQACSDGVGKQTATVGRYQPNAWGLHDMHGNLWEWVQDCWNDSYRGAPTDGSAWETGNCKTRVMRGGCWYDPPENLRAANRSRPISGARSYGEGFRVARTLTP